MSEPAADESWGVLKTTAIQPGRFLDEHNKALPGHLEPRPALEVRPGDLLLTNAGPRARCAIPCLVRSTRARLMLSGKIYRFRADPGVMDSRFLELYLLSEEAQADLDARKTGISDSGLNLTRSRFLEMLVPCPTVSEQQRIVELLDDHLSRLDAAAVDMLRARQRARALELSFVNALLHDASAVTRPLADLLDLSIGGVWGLAPGDDEHDVDVLRVTELRSRGRLDPKTSARRSVTKKVLASRQLQPGDLLLEKSGGGPKQPVGRVGMVTELQGPSVCSNFMQLMRPRRALVEPGFLHLYLNALHESGGTSHMQRASTNIRNIKASEYEAIQVPVPDLEAQRRGLASAQASAAEVDRLRFALDAGERRSRALRRALLAAAFSGRLTSAASARETEEMASV